MPTDVTQLKIVSWKFESEDKQEFDDYLSLLKKYGVPWCVDKKDNLLMLFMDAKTEIDYLINIDNKMSGIHVDKELED